MRMGQAQEQTSPSSRGWRGRAACGDADPDRFDADVASVCTLRRAVVEFCVGCPVRAECLGEALALSDVGVRGGLLLNGTPKPRSLRNVKCHCDDCEPPVPVVDAEPPAANTVERQ